MDTSNIEQHDVDVDISFDLDLDLKCSGLKIGAKIRVYIRIL